VSLDRKAPARPPSRWVLTPAAPEQASSLATRLGLPELTAQCLLNRGFKDADAIDCFLNPRLSRLSDPFQLRDLETAALRILAAKSRREKVLIFGDYDVDGISSVAILHGLLCHFGIECSYYLPNREAEGYGLTEKAVSAALARFPARLLIAVDCGSSATDLIEKLQSDGVEVMVLDHHPPPDPAPRPACFINPHHNTSEGSPFRELCSAGLVFKLAHGLVKAGRQAGCVEASNCDVRQWLDLAALATVADLVPLTGENRLLLTAGLNKLNDSPRPGMAALIAAAGIKRKIGVYEIGFQLGPRLNAAGRLESASQALRLLLSTDAKESASLAAELDDQNRQRQEIEREVLEQVLEKCRPSFDPAADWVIVEGHDSWHIGVVGIVAARVLREFHRPSIILGGGPPWRGSGRSIPGFDLGAALHDCHDLLVGHGGHAMAAGVTMEPAQIEAFRRRLNEVARSRLTPEDLRPVIRLDQETRLSELSPRQVESLAALGPFGQGHPQIQLMSRRVRLAREPLRMGADQQHAKLWITDGGEGVEAVCWNAAPESLPKMGAEFDLAFIPELNTFRGNTRLQLRVLDWREPLS